MTNNDEPVNILIVDDNPDKLTALESIVSDLANCVTVRSGKDALTQLLIRDFAVILLDVNMPIMDGFETATMIRQRLKSENTPIIFITAYLQTQEFAAKGYALGAVDYIFAPVVPEVLRAKVKVFVELFRLYRAIKLQSEKLARQLDHINRLNLELQIVNKELESFSYSVSHDLRAPLRSLEGFSNILLRKYSDTLPKDGQDCLDRIRQASQHMDRLIDDILRLSRMSRAEMKRGEVDLSRLAVEIVSELRDSQPGRSVDVVIPDGLVTQGDEPLIRVALTNLLGNAWKFTGKQPSARIEFGVTSSSGEQAYFVRDNGVGFDMAQYDKLFGTFQRLHSPDDYEGTGIGLAIVQRIIRRHGGKVWAEGAVGEGATFYFTLQGENK